MNPKVKKRISRIGLLILLVYIFGGIALYLMQDKILFHPKSVPYDHPFSFEQPFEELTFPVNGCNVSIIRFKAVAARKGIVLFYHGNMKNVEHYKKYPAFFLRNNYEIWMIDYPGFGKTTGKRTEAMIYEQALFMYNMASKDIGSDGIIIYGKSIGTGVASYVAAKNKCRQLVLETPYYSIPSLAKHYFPIYPVNSMIKYNFPVYEYLDKVQAPTTILHGTKDEIIPFKQALLLRKKHPKIYLVPIKNGKHNNLSEFDPFQRTIDSLLFK